MAPTIAVVGPGAIGTTIAATLHEAGRTPMLCGRTARDCLELHTDTSTITVPGPVLTDPSSVTSAVDLVFLAVKATQIAAAAGWLKALCHAQTVVCVLENGVEQVRMVEPYCAGATVVPAVVWFPARPQSDGSVNLLKQARLTLTNTPAANVVAQALEGTRCAVELADDFTTLAWRKLLINTIGGLMVLTGRHAGIFRREDIAHLTIAYLGEGLKVARAEGANLSDEVPNEILDQYQAFPPDMGSSILTDREQGRPLEWDIRNGVIQRCGRLHGIPTPISDVIVPLLAAASGPA